jgi:outer membrane protein TolC
MNSREEAMLDAVNDVADKLEDLAMEHEAAVNLNQALRDMRESLRNVQDLYRHQAGRLSAPYAERTPPSCALPGLSAVLAPGGK